MTVLDTNVVSELMRRDADAKIVDWLDHQPAQSVWITAITVFEVLFGLELIEPGRRRTRLQEAFSRAVEEEFEGRVLPFDSEAAAEAASRAAQLRTTGKSVDFRDLEIAGIVAARHATLATRNTRHFNGLGVDLINPWTAR